MSRPDKAKRVYLECSAVVSVMADEPGCEVIQRVMESAHKGAVELITSTMMLVEARGQGHGNDFDAELEKKVLKVVDNPAWVLIELDRSVALKARELAVQLGLKNADAVHLASAIVAGADVFMTLDTDFPIDQQVEGVWVCLPYPLEGPDLFVQG